MGAGTGGPPALHPQLAADCHVLGGSRGCLLLLHRNAAIPWFVLVPPSEVLELHELPSSLRADLDAAADRLAQFVKRHFACDKINVAAIGNVVPQLHLHVVGRRRDDACWPRPVWGHLDTSGVYETGGLARLTEALLAAGCLDREEDPPR
jgi:diadenosine tetraphosphate (Ap4A) HIT family hydrolase